MFLLNWVSRLQKLKYGARSYKNLASGFARPRSVTCVHKPWHLEWNTPGSPGRYAGIFGGLLSKHRRYQAFTFFEVESGMRSKAESKTGKKPNGPNRKSNRLTKEEKSTYLVPHWIITWADWCGARFALATNLLSRITVPRNSICRTLLQTKGVYFAQTLYQHQSALPYMGCCTLSSCSSNKGPRILGPTIQIDQDVDRYSPWRCCCWRCCCCCCCCRWLGVAPKMKSGRPIKIRINNF